MALLVSCAAPPASLSLDLRSTPLASGSPAYVRLPEGFRNDTLSRPSLPPSSLRTSWHARAVCNYFAREHERLACEHRLLCWAMASGPPGLELPCAAKVSFGDGDESTCASRAASLSSVASNVDSEEEVALSSTSSNDGSAGAAPASKPRLAKKALTTIIVRNLPDCYTRERAIDLLEQHGCRASCDFLYLPVDFNTGKTLGYVILNFVTAAAAELCHTRVSGEPVSSIAYEVIWASTQQGLSANIKRYRNNAVMHSSVPDEYKPMLLLDGERIPFPVPQRDIRPPPDRVERTRTAIESITTAI